MLALVTPIAYADVTKTITFKCTATVVDFKDRTKIYGYYCPNAQLHIVYNDCDNVIPDHCDSYSVIEDQLSYWRPEFSSKVPIETTITIHLPDNVKNYSAMLVTEPVSPNSAEEGCMIPFEGKTVFEWTGSDALDYPPFRGKCLAY